MKSLLKIMLSLALIFASTFLIIKSTGIISIEKIELWLKVTQLISPIYVAGLVITLLFADLFIAVPTLSVIILGGFFLGSTYGAITAITGLMLAGTGRYLLSYIYGEKIVKILIKDDIKRHAANMAFQKHGVITILLSRAVPILPEVSACMAGVTRIRFTTFITVWCISTIPYALIATYAGSISSIDNPKPAVFTAIGLTSFFWIGWFIFRRSQKQKSKI
jgi:uncharacterized membrane protein YdjX (TVP38/TMEM64 family)